VRPRPASAPPSQVASAAAGEDARVYEAAQNQRRIGNYQAAIVAFQGFLAQYPKSALAPRAQYWIGDSYFNLRDFKNAIANQQKLVANYPDSASVPDAMLNMASSQLELGDMASARRTMDNLITRYPTSEAAEKAKRRLATLR
jgi:tol-pal system protein YbgF